MTYLQTEYFMYVAQNKSITKTSAELYVSPPAISKQISLLEQELGVKLFVRSAKGMELSPAGEEAGKIVFRGKEKKKLIMYPLFQGNMTLRKRKC